MERSELLKILTAKQAILDTLTTDLAALFDQAEAEELLDEDELAILDQTVSRLHHVIEERIDWVDDED